MSSYNNQQNNKGTRMLGALVMTILVIALLVIVALRWFSDSGKEILPPVPVAAEQHDENLQAITPVLTEAAPETEETPEEIIDTDIDKLIISEIMPRNSSFLVSSDFGFYDWIEIHNISSEPVDLSGWGLSDGGSEPWRFPGQTLEPDGYLVVFASKNHSQLNELCADFAISQDETVSLISPKDFVECEVMITATEKDVSLVYKEGGIYAVCEYPTPGMSNTLDHYDLYLSQLTCEGPLVISEVLGGNLSYLKTDDGYEDIIEIRNISEETVELSDYYLSDDSSDYFLWNFPEKMLEPGKSVIVYCSGETERSTSSSMHAGFKIDAVHDSVFLSTSERLVDYLSYSNVPVNGSMGRLPDQPGIFRFAKATPENENKNGYRRQAEKPRALTADGVYNNVESVSVELYSDGTIYYTTDGTTPTSKSPVYTEPISLTSTTIVRAYCEQSELADSKELVLSYIINENHTLPVLSLVADTYDDFSTMYNNGWKYRPVRGSISLYEENGGFTAACGIRVKGWTSRELPKKSLGVEFSGSYGDGAIDYDVFDTGISNYENLSIRAGQDYTFSVVRNELMQELCLEMTDSVPTQHSKYCILYINGKYWGIYCLKEDINKAYYANWTGTDKSQVVQFKSPINDTSYQVYQEVFQWAIDHDLSTDEDYHYFCDNIFDIDNLIDWIILEGFSSNSDINGNMRYFKTEGGKWQIVYYDLDWAFYYKVNCFANTLNPPKQIQVYMLIKRLMKNEEFCEKLARRSVEVLRTTLSNEHVLEKLDELVAIVEPEMQREQKRWNLSMEGWRARVKEVQNWIINNDWDEYCIKKVLGLLKVSADLREELTGG